MMNRALLTALIGVALAGSGCSSTPSLCETGERSVERRFQQTDDIRVEYLITGDGESSVHDPALAPDGRIWYVDTWKSCLGVVDPATGRVTEHATRDPDARPHGIHVGDDGVVWYAATATGAIGRFDPATGDHREYRVPDQPVDPHTILVSGGRVWFTAPRANAFGYIDVDSETLERFDGPYPGSSPYGLAAGPDGAIWITFGGVSRIGRVLPESDRLHLYELPDASRARRISIAPDGAVWYTDRMGHTIGRMDPTTGSVESHPAAGDRAFPLSIVTDANGDIWYFEEGTARLVRLVPECSSEAVVSLDLPGVIVRHMVPDPAGEAVWIALGEAGGVARVSSARRGTCDRE
jgi:virginiamycin B lyase